MSEAIANAESVAIYYALDGAKNGHASAGACY